MAYAISTSTTRKSSGLFSGLIDSIATWRKRQLAAAELRALDDRMLDDLGVSRSEIDSVVRDGVRR